MLSFVYKWYLEASVEGRYYPDYVTQLVAHQTQAVLNTMGYQTILENHPDEPSIKTIVNGVYLARILEGCNALSVIILFVSFMVAFAGRLKPTVLYILAGSVIIYAINILRLVFIMIVLCHYPQYQELLHGVIFPLIIYGTMFLLWMFWVNRFTALQTKKKPV